jgi:hypothetical protein
VSNDEPLERPTIAEQGREYDLFVRVDGEWKIKKRVVIADSAVPEGMLDTWERALDYDILAEE